jgi:hypothetical protein
VTSALHVILGSTECKARLRVMRRHGWGRMWTVPRHPLRPYEGERWGFDNGAYGYWKRGEQFNEPAFCKCLDRAEKVGRPYLAVLPDVVGGGLASLEYSLSWLDRVPREWPWYLAVQDGMTPAAVAPELHRFAGLFLGGTNDFKETAHAWCDLAHAAGLKFHYARAGTKRKMLLARLCGADSLDSAFPLWKRERLEAYERWFLEGQEQLLIRW